MPKKNGSFEYRDVKIIGLCYKHTRKYGGEKDYVHQVACHKKASLYAVIKITAKILMQELLALQSIFISIFR